MTGDTSERVIETSTLGAHFVLREIRFARPGALRLLLAVRVDSFPNPITTSF